MPFAPVAASDPLAWVGLEAARFRSSPAAALNHPALTHHMLVLFARPPEELDLRYDGVRRHVPPVEQPATFELVLSLKTAKALESGRLADGVGVDEALRLFRRQGKLPRDREPNAMEPFVGPGSVQPSTGNPFGLSLS